MNHYLRLGKNNLIYAYSNSDAAPGADWVRVDFDPHTEGVLQGTRKRLVDGKLVDTYQPLIPPALYMDWDDDTLAWVPNAGRAWDSVRAERNKRLADSDWVTLPDVPLAPEQRTAWMLYRQGLRDVTEQPDPTAINWPQPPG